MSITEEGKSLYSETKRILKKAEQEHQLVIFVGSGISIPSGLPSWDNSINQIKDKLNLSKDFDLDKIKIPQYYYNTRGKKEYTQLVREIFKYGDDLQPNKLHDLIMQFNVNTIVTTNYDRLIERSAENNGIFLNVVSKDNDLPYRNSNKELIKMHGDFENDNFVLKEDDYLNYSNNFKLIENYIKSLIGSKTILFLGYSLQDPDLKQIFTWVKQILVEDFQLAYMVSPGRRPNEIEREYYKNLGVNIIYPVTCVEEDKKEDLSFQTETILKYFLEEEEIEKLDCMYEELHNYTNLNYIYHKYLDDYLVSASILRTKAANNDFNLLNRDAIEFLFDDIKTNSDDEISKINLIKNVLKNNLTPYSNEFGATTYNLIFNFDYDGLNNRAALIEKGLNEDNLKSQVELAFIYTQLNDFQRAYTCLKNISPELYKRKMYIWYFIAEYNRQISGRICTNLFNKHTLTDDKYNQIINEINCIDLNKIIQTLPKLDNKDNQFLKDIESSQITTNLFYEVYSESLKTSEEARKTYSLHTGPSSYEKLRESVQDFNKYELYNFLLLDKNSECLSTYQMYIRSIVSSAMAPKMESSTEDDDTFSNISNIKLEALSSFDLFILLKYLNVNQIRDIFLDNKVNSLPVDEDASKYLETIGPSFCNYVKVFPNTYAQDDIFWRYLEVINRIKFNANIANMVLDRLSIINNSSPITIHFNRINKFILNCIDLQLCKTNNTATKINKFTNVLLKLAEKEDNYRFGTLLDNLFYALKEAEKPYNKPFNKKILIERNYPWLSRGYQSLGSDNKKTLTKLFNKWEITSSNYNIYLESVCFGPIEMDQDIEEDIYKTIYNKINNKKNDNGFRTYPNQTQVLLTNLINCYLNGKINNLDELKKVVKYSDSKMNQWLIDLDEFNYKDFDLNWLSLCHSGLLKTVSKNDTARNEIIKIFKDKFSKNEITSNIENIIVKYFI